RSESSHYMGSSEMVAAIVFMLQVAQLPSCTITNVCRLGYNTADKDYLHVQLTTSLYDCLKTCYSIENCTYALFQTGFCYAFADINFKTYVDYLDCNYYRIERDSIADPKHCKPVSDLL
ncbi:hypothetical protein V3C99_007221, partial [Haemonchus contortus]|uniref:Apple domain-containing protein n=1 Tax=Haemonchus contortus TaxID=6289 RepID=A0A7I4YNU4_HAECO